MEHRWSKRKPIALDALVHYPPIGMVRAKVRDIGVGGMFIETGVITLNVNALVEVNVRIQKDGTDRPYRLRALVVRTAPHGAGLMFRSFDHASYGVLRELVFEDRGMTAARGASFGPIETGGVGEFARGNRSWKRNN